MFCIHCLARQRGLCARGLRQNQKRFIEPQIRQHLDYLEGELGQSSWFAGEAFSGADVQLSFVLEAAAARGGLDASRPRLMDFLRRIHARPAYQRAIERGGKYAILT